MWQGSFVGAAINSGMGMCLGFGSGGLNIAVSKLTYAQWLWTGGVVMGPYVMADAVGIYTGFRAGTSEIED